MKTADKNKMTLEEKLKAKVKESLTTEFSQSGETVTMSYQKVVLLSDALTICQQEIDEACKKQREICAIHYQQEEYKAVINQEMVLPKIDFTNIILNAPSPKESE